MVETTTEEQTPTGRATRGSRAPRKPKEAVEPVNPTEGSENGNDPSNSSESDPVSWTETHPHQHRESDYKKHSHKSTEDKAVAEAHKKAMLPVNEQEASLEPPQGRERGRTGVQPQTSFDEVVLDVEDYLDLRDQLDIRERNQKAHTEWASADRKAKQKLLGDDAEKGQLGLRDGKDHVLRLGEHRILIVGATGEIKNITTSRRPVTKVRINSKD